MSPIQLERLRPQINAVVSQYQTSDIFIQSLKSLLESYHGDIEISSAGISPYSLIPKLNIPNVILNQLEISLQFLAHKHPVQTIEIVNKLWVEKELEYKSIAIFLLSNLPKNMLDVYFGKVEEWINQDTEAALINVIMENSYTNPEIYKSDYWLSLVERWLVSKSYHVRKVGISSLTHMVTSDSFQILPAFFRMVELIFNDLHVSLHKDLMQLIQSMTEYSQPETAAFLIHLAIISPRKEIFTIIRKFLPFFDNFYANEIKNNIPD